MKPFHERYVCNSNVKNDSMNRLVEYVHVDGTEHNDQQLNFDFYAPVENATSVYVQCYPESTKPFKEEDEPLLIIKVPDVKLTQTFCYPNT